MALSGKVETSAYEFKNGTRTVILEWTATQDFEANTTTIEWQAVGGGTYTSNPVVCELRVTIDGDVEFYKGPVSGNRVNCSIGTVLATGTKVIEHNSDGTRNVSMTIEAGIYEWKINKTGSANFVLSPIPKPSTVSATNANIGEKSTIVVVQKGQPTTHSIKYEFGALSGYVTADGGKSDSESIFSATTVLWVVPESFYSQIPSAKSGTCKLTIKTYSGTSQIGDSKTGSFVATASKESSSPSVSGSVVDSNNATKALTGDASKFVRYHSTALCTITATPKNSASISEKKIGGVAVSGTTRTIKKIEMESIDFYAKDSRGYESSKNVGISLIPYIILTNNPIGQRTDPTSGNATLTVKGDYFNDTFGSEENSISIKYRIRPAGGSYGDYIPMEAVVSGNSYTANADLTGLDYKTQYELEVVVSDKLEKVTKTAKINKGVPVCDWGENDFRINVALRVLEACYGPNFPDNPKNGQVFFLLQNGSYAVKIYNGESWV